ncbi:hypothetical protein [Treponema sp.]
MNSKELSQKEAELILEKQNEYFNSQATKDVNFIRRKNKRKDKIY